MPCPGLVARWGLNEGAGDTVYGSAGTGINGTLTGQAWNWTCEAAPFNIVIDNPPLEPMVIDPKDMSAGVSLSPMLEVSVADPESMPLDVTYFGRQLWRDELPSFSIVVLPDAQYYTAQMHGGTPDIFIAQTQWIAENRDSLNIVFVDQVGDIVDHGDDSPEEWVNAWSAMSILEDTLATGLPEGIPYSVDVGNHDQTPKNDPDGTTFYYNKYFGAIHFTGRSYYGGHYGANSDNHYVLFDGGGFGFVVISLEFDESPNSEVLDWADSLLACHQDRWAIVSSHHLIGEGNPASFTPHGQIIYDWLKHNPNLFLMLCGHMAGEGRRTDTYSGNTVHTVMANYQNMPNGGDGWLRIMTFDPGEGTVDVKTYSPTLDQFDADSTSQFTLDCDLNWGTNWGEIGTVDDVPSGSNCSIVWPGLCSLTEYEWYISVSDSLWAVDGPVWSFTTRSEPPNVTVVWPNGGEELEAGTKVTLRWKANDDVDVTGVDLYLSRSGPVRQYETIATGLVGVDSLQWTVTGPSTEDGYFKVVAHDGDGNAGEDISDGAFSILEPTLAAGSKPYVGDFAFRLDSAHPVQSSAEFIVYLPFESSLNVSVYDIQGRMVDVVADGTLRRGGHRVLWNLPGGSIASGVYFVRARTDDKEILGKVVILR
jgi:hypothetical protein